MFSRQRNLVCPICQRLDAATGTSLSCSGVCLAIAPKTHGPASRRHERERPWSCRSLQVQPALARPVLSSMWLDGPHQPCRRGFPLRGARSAHQALTGSRWRIDRWLSCQEDSIMHTSFADQLAGLDLSGFTNWPTTGHPNRLPVRSGCQPDHRQSGPTCSRSLLIPRLKPMPRIWLGASSICFIAQPSARPCAMCWSRPASAKG